MGQRSNTLVQKVWNYAHVLKDDGLAFMDGEAVTRQRHGLLSR